MAHKIRNMERRGSVQSLMGNFEGLGFSLKTPKTTHEFVFAFLGDPII